MGNGAFRIQGTAKRQFMKRIGIGKRLGHRGLWHRWSPGGQNTTRRPRGSEGGNSGQVVLRQPSPGVKSGPDGTTTFRRMVERRNKRVSWPLSPTEIRTKRAPFLSSHRETKCSPPTWPKN